MGNIQSGVDRARNALKSEPTVGGFNECEALPFAGQPKTVRDIFYDDYPETGTELDIYIHPDWMTDVAKHNEVFNDSITREWENADPAEDRLKPD